MSAHSAPNPDRQGREIGKDVAGFCRYIEKENRSRLAADRRAPALESL